MPRDCENYINNIVKETIKQGSLEGTVNCEEGGKIQGGTVPLLIKYSFPDDDFEFEVRYDSDELEGSCKEQRDILERQLTEKGLEVSVIRDKFYIKKGSIKTSPENYNTSLLKHSGDEVRDRYGLEVSPDVLREVREFGGENPELLSPHEIAGFLQETGLYSRIKSKHPDKLRKYFEDLKIKVSDK